MVSDRLREAGAGPQAVSKETLYWREPIISTPTTNINDGRPTSALSHPLPGVYDIVSSAWFNGH